MASLQLLCTAGGNQAKLDSRSEFEISHRSPNGGVKLVGQQAVVGSLAVVSGFVLVSPAVGNFA